MTDKEFIDRLNDIMFDYGCIVIDSANYEYYVDRYKLKNYYMEYLDARYFHRFHLFNIKESVVVFGFTSVDMIINDHLGIFELVKQDIYRTDKFFPVDFVNFIMSIEGTSKEEIILKLQMMGY